MSSKIPNETINERTNNQMTRTEKLADLTEWLAQYREIDAVYKDMSLLFMQSPECRWAQVLYITHDRWTSLLSRTVGDDVGTLSWWLYECDGGRKPLEAKAASWDKPRAIETVEDLLDLIEAGSEVWL